MPDNLHHRRAAASASAGAPRRKAAAACREWLVVSGAGGAYEEVGRHGIMDRSGIPARDLRVLDPLLSYPSTILIRERAIVVNLEQIKAIITASEVLIPNSRDPVVFPFVHDLQSRVSASSAPPYPVGVLNKIDGEAMEKGDVAIENGTGPRLDTCKNGSAKVLPFEFKALEVCLESACRCLENETSSLEQQAYPALDELTSKISTLNLENVRQIKSRLVAITGRVQKVRDELEHLLDDDMDMAEMYLTRKLFSQAAGESPSRVDADNINFEEEEREENCRIETASFHESLAGFKPNVEELEMLLEAYFVQIDGTLSKLSHLREYVDDTEDYINIMLDEKQNQLLQMGVTLSTATVVGTAGIVVVSLFGMNIHIGIMNDQDLTPEEAAIANTRFWVTTWGTVAGCVLLYLLVIFWGKKSNLLR